MRLVLLPMAFLLFSPAADAAKKRHKRPNHHRSPRVKAKVHAATVSVGPWSVSFRPNVQRPGYHWVSGHMVRGRVVPGYWRPVVQRPGLIYVQGYWAEDSYVDGHWREEERDGLVWSEGYYDEDGQWVEGVWLPVEDVDVDVIFVEDLDADESEDFESVEPAETDIWLQSGDQELHAEPPGF